MAKTLAIEIKAQNKELKRSLAESKAYTKELERQLKQTGQKGTDAVDDITASLTRFKREAQTASGSISDAFSNLRSGNISSAVSSLGGISSKAAVAATAVGAIGTVAVMAGSKIADLVGEGIELAQQAEGIKHRFEEIGGTSIYLESLREHTHGLVNDLELMKATVKAKDFNIPMKDLGTYLEFAQLKSQQTGESVDYLVDSIVTGLGRQSVQILDNLGISAAELKSKMAEGKTMTEAVAEVINKQLSEAGEHFETTAEKAQRKLVELQNEQMRVGEQLAPLKSDWDSFLTSVEIWAMKAVQKLGELFSEAQRIKNLQNDMQSGSYGSNKNIEAFKTIKDGKGHQKNYQWKVNQHYNKEINKELEKQKKLQAEINKPRTRSRGAATEYGVSELGTLKEYNNQLRKSQEKVKALRNEQAHFNKVTNSLMNPQTTNISGGNTGGGGKSGGGKSGGRTSTVTPKVEPIIPQGSIKYIEEQLSKKRVEFSLATSPESRRQIQKEINDLLSQKQTMEIQAKFDFGQTGTKGANISDLMKKQFTDIDFDSIQQEASKKMGAVVEKINEEETRKWQEGEEKKQKIKELQQQTLDSMINAASSAADAFEMPEFDVLGTVAQAISNIALGFSEATVQAASLGPWAWIAFAAAGLAETIAAIASIKSATSGYANGGIIGGSMMHGDNMLARVNSGEMILNGNQQSNLFNMINDGNNGAFGGNVHFVLRGADLYGSMKNFSKTKSLVGKNTGIK